MSNDTELFAALQAENETLKQEHAALRQRIAELEAARASSKKNEYEQLQLIIDATNDGMWDWNIETNSVYYSLRWKTMLGYEPDELAGHLDTWERLLHPEDKPYVLHMVERHMRGETHSFTIEFRMQMKSGEWKWILGRGKVVERNEQGLPRRMVGTHTDISQRKATEQALKHSSEMLTTVMDSIGSLIYVSDMDTYEMLYMNKVGRDAFGEIAGRKCWEIVQQGQTGPCSFCTIPRLIDDQGNPTGRYHWEFQNTVNGRWYHIVDQAITWTDGRIVRLEVASDIHEHKQAEEEVRIFKSVVENAPDGVSFVSPDGIISYANAAMKAMLGYGDEYVGSPVPVVFGGDASKPMQIIQHVMEHGSWQGMETYYRKDGSTVQVHLLVFTIRDAEGNILTFPGIVRDITDLQQAEQERLNLQQQIIDTQQHAIRELSTPLLPLHENVLAMPLVGTIDSSRAMMIMETLLEGIAEHQADIAIIDITGVKVVDTQVAQAIIHTAQAVKLLGAQIILTGIQPQMAQTLVHLGADMSGIMTCSTLQAGIAFIMGDRKYVNPRT